MQLRNNYLINIMEEVKSKNKNPLSTAGSTTRRRWQRATFLDNEEPRGTQNLPTNYQIHY